MISDLTKSILIKATTSQAVNKSANGPSTSKTQQPQAGIGAWHGRGDRESEDADNEGSSESESESESEIGEEVPSGMENDESGPAEPSEDDKFNIDDEVDINAPVLRKIIGQDSDTIVQAVAASKPAGSHQQISTNTSFEMNDEDFNKLWES